MIKFILNIKFLQALVLPGLVLFIACSSEKGDVADFVQDVNYQYEEATDVTLIYSDSAQVRMELNAPIFRRYSGEKGYIEMPSGVIGRTYDPAGNRLSILTADYAKRFIADRATHAEGNVVLRNVKGDTLNTEKISWFETQDSIYTAEPVTIKTPSHTIKGVGLTSNSSFTKYKILNVTGVLTVDQPE